jgi:hypothetical protein
MVNADISIVRNIFYAVLALLIEVCALGLISLCRTHEQEEVVLIKPPFPVDDLVKDFDKLNVEAISEKIEVHSSQQPIINNDLKNVNSSCPTKKNESKLIYDIKNGVVSPVFNKLKDLDYDVSQVRIRVILKDLKDAGILIDGKRRSLVLANRPLSIVKA